MQSQSFRWMVWVLDWLSQWIPLTLTGFGWVTMTLFRRFVEPSALPLLGAVLVSASVPALGYQLTWLVTRPVSWPTGHAPSRGRRLLFRVSGLVVPVGLWWGLWLALPIVGR